MYLDPWTLRAALEVYFFACTRVLEGGSERYTPELGVSGS